MVSWHFHSLDETNHNCRVGLAFLFSRQLLSGLWSLHWVPPLQLQYPISGLLRILRVHQVEP